MGNCPECGTPVEKSVRLRQYLATVDWRWIVRGSLLVCLAGGCLLLAVFRYPRYTVPPHGGKLDVTYYFGGLGAAVLLLAGVVCFRWSKWRIPGSKSPVAKMCIVTAVLYLLAVFASTSLNFTDGIILQDYLGPYVAHYGIRQWIPLAQASAYLCAIGLMAATWIAIKGVAAMCGNRWWMPATTGYIILALIPLVILFLYSIGNALAWQNIAFDPLGPIRGYVEDNEYYLERDYAFLVFSYWLFAALAANKERRFCVWEVTT